MKNWLIYVASSFIILESKCMVYSRANVLKKKKIQIAVSGVHIYLRNIPLGSNFYV